MSKELKRELFNIYDVVVFEDENGITQDCVCAIGKEKEIDEIVDVIQCNNHSISIYDNGNYKVWEKDGKNLPYYATNKKIIHLYTLKNDNRFYDIYPTDDYEKIDKANPSEALEQIDIIESELCDSYYSYQKYSKKFDIIKQALIKAQEQEKVLEIIKEKSVDIKHLKWCINNPKKLTTPLLNYNIDMNKNEELTEEEYDLLKEVVGK